MIDKADFYHGAALAAALNDPRCIDVAPCAHGYLFNNSVLAFMKYTVKGGSPWQFTFSAEDKARLEHCPDGVERVVLTLICGGDGICTISAETACMLLRDAGTWIAVRRKFHGWYAVNGPAGPLSHKVAPKLWPEILFQKEESNDEQ